MDRDTGHSENPDVLYHELSTGELFDRARQADARAMEQLYYQFRDGILNYVWLVTGNHDLAVDAVKHVFKELFEQLETLATDQPLKRFLYRRVNSFLSDADNPDPVTAQSGWELSSETYAGEGDWTGPSSDRQIPRTTERFVTCFKELPGPLRKAAGLYLMASFSVDDVMRITGESADAIRARLDEALRRIRVRLQDGPDVKERTPDCSLASERTWLQFQSGNTATSETSNLREHREKCDECRTVSRGIEQVREHVEDFHLLDLAPFPKGDESDLLTKAREAATRISQETPEGPEMDPDLRQVLWLIPWGLALVLLLSVVPLAFQNRTETSGDTTAETEATSRRTVVLQTGGRSVERVELRITSSREARVEIRAGDEKPPRSIDLERHSSSSDSDRNEIRTVTVSFTPPYPSGTIQVLRLKTGETEHIEGESTSVEVIEAIDPEGNSIPVTVEFGA